LADEGRGTISIAERNLGNAKHPRKHRLRCSLITEISKEEGRKMAKNAEKSRGASLDWDETSALADGRGDFDCRPL